MLHDARPDLAGSQSPHIINSLPEGFSRISDIIDDQNPLVSDIHCQRKTNRSLRPLTGCRIPVLNLDAGEKIVQKEVADYPGGTYPPRPMAMIRSGLKPEDLIRRDNLRESWYASSQVMRRQGRVSEVIDLISSTGYAPPLWE